MDRRTAWLNVHVGRGTMDRDRSRGTFKVPTAIADEALLLDTILLLPQLWGS